LTPGALSLPETHSAPLAVQPAAQPALECSSADQRISTQGPIVESVEVVTLTVTLVVIEEQASYIWGWVKTLVPSEPQNSW